VQSVLLEQDENRYQLRTDLVGSAPHAFAVAGVRPPEPVFVLLNLLLSHNYFYLAVEFESQNTCAVGP